MVCSHLSTLAFFPLLVADLNLVVQGVVFSPVPFQPDMLLDNSEQGSEQENRENFARNGLTALRLMLNDSLKRFFPPKDVSWLSAKSFPHGLQVCL